MKNELYGNESEGGTDFHMNSFARRIVLTQAKGNLKRPNTTTSYKIKHEQKKWVKKV